MVNLLYEKGVSEECMAGKGLLIGSFLLRHV